MSGRPGKATVVHHDITDKGAPLANREATGSHSPSRPPEQERREAPRVATSAMGVICLGNERIPFWLVNLSLGGALLAPSRAVAVGSFVRLNLSLPELDEMLDLDAVVERTTTVDGALAVAVEFVGMSAKTRTLLRAYISWSLEEMPTHEALPRTSACAGGDARAAAAPPPAHPAPAAPRVAPARSAPADQRPDPPMRTPSRADTRPVGAPKDVLQRYDLRTRELRALYESAIRDAVKEERKQKHQMRPPPRRREP
jgi:hypothetical protein